MSWQTRTVAQYIAATVRTDKGKPNALLEQAGSIALDAQERREMEAASASAADVPAVTENKPGSFERFLGSFGSPSRWRG